MRMRYAMRTGTSCVALIFILCESSSKDVGRIYVNILLNIFTPLITGVATVSGKSV